MTEWNLLKIMTKKGNLIFHFDSTTLNLKKQIVENFQEWLKSIE